VLAQANKDPANPAVGVVRLCGALHDDERTAFLEVARQLCTYVGVGALGLCGVGCGGQGERRGLLAAGDRRRGRAGSSRGYKVPHKVPVCWYR
jgi:hypothetical protein